MKKETRDYDFNRTPDGLDRNDLNSLRDVLFSALGKTELRDDQVISYWEKLPDYIKLDALKWGMSDTPTREEAYLWLKENC